ncbi:MAG: BREX-1 system phosphatase PglZ type A, partial [Planctomycetes bacterium]|nr:BREX-1 system phosphatase PglZ type A [Planctomycetota bacterium]
MNLTQIQDTLHKIYHEEGQRLVFWYDADAEFLDVLPSLELEGVEILRMDENGSLALKIKLELEDRQGKYLLYAPHAAPGAEDDWLLDVKFYSHNFHADKASIILNELGLTVQSLRPYLDRRKKFFRSQERLSRLRKWVVDDDNEASLDLKMLAVLTRVDHPNFFSILMKLFGSFCSEDAFAPDSPARMWEDLDKLDLTEPFWELVGQNFGYSADEPRIADLLIRLLVTDLTNHLQAEPPSGLAHFIIPQGPPRQNASVFLSQWRTTIGQFQDYNTIARHLGKSLRLDDILAAYEPHALAAVATFDAVERRIISALRDAILSSVESFDAVLEVIRTRRDSHWLTTATGSGERNLYPATYEALEAAISLFTLRKRHDAGLSYPTAKEMFSAYTGELFRFDQYYRLFHEAAERLEMGGWDVLKNLVNSIDDLYSGWYMEQLAVAWDSFMDPAAGEGLLGKWSFFMPYNQYQFFDRYVRTQLREKARSRIFVIISDAFRYEVAEELTREMNGKYRLKASLEAMLGVLPSYTGLGMAALLPHRQLTCQANGDILVDGKPAASLEQRSDILAAQKGIAIKADELMAMNKAQGREFVRPYEVIYIYHNQIDALGDKTVTEARTFSATRTAIDEISALVRFLVNNLNGGYIVATADHGYIYQEKSPAHTDKSVLAEKPAGTVKAKKRYIIGINLG